MTTNANLSALNHDALFQMALDASIGGDSVTAIACLQEAVARPGCAAMTHYLLGAEYAQLGRYDSAAPALETALVLDPSLHAARLQLGMLYLGADDEARAIDVLAPLERLDQERPLRHFAAGLVLLTRGEPAAALESLEKGMGLNHDLPALNADMQRIAGAIRQLDTAQGGQHVLLSAYASNRAH